jgi:YHS domain-containing protein
MANERHHGVRDSHLPATTDPVCGMTVDPATAARQAVHGGRTYYFCSTHCLHCSRAIRQGTCRAVPQSRLSLRQAAGWSIPVRCT